MARKQYINTPRSIDKNRIKHATLHDSRWILAHPELHAACDPDLLTACIEKEKRLEQEMEKLKVPIEVDRLQIEVNLEQRGTQQKPQDKRFDLPTKFGTDLIDKLFNEDTLYGELFRKQVAESGLRLITEDVMSTCEQDLRGGLSILPHGKIRYQLGKVTTKFAEYTGLPFIIPIAIIYQTTHKILGTLTTTFEEMFTSKKATYCGYLCVLIHGWSHTTKQYEQASFMPIGFSQMTGPCLRKMSVFLGDGFDLCADKNMVEAVLSVFHHVLKTNRIQHINAASEEGKALLELADDFQIGTTNYITPTSLLEHLVEEALKAGSIDFEALRKKRKLIIPTHFLTEVGENLGFKEIGMRRRLKSTNMYITTSYRYSKKFEKRTETAKKTAVFLFNTTKYKRATGRSILDTIQRIYKDRIQDFADPLFSDNETAEDFCNAIIQYRTDQDRELKKMQREEKRQKQLHIEECKHKALEAVGTAKEIKSYEKKMSKMEWKNAYSKHFSYYQKKAQDALQELKMLIDEKMYNDFLISEYNIIRYGG